MSGHQRRVVVGYDGSHLALDALNWAADDVRRDGGCLEVVVASFVHASDDWYATDQPYHAMVRRVTADAQQLLDALRLPDARLRRDVGDPLTVLVEASHEADLLVVGALGHGPVEGQVTGSVSRHLAAHAASTIVVVRPVYRSDPRIVVGVDASEHGARALRFAVERAASTGVPLTVVHGWRPGQWLSHDLTKPETGDTDVEQGQRLLAEMTAGLAEEFPAVPVTTEAIPVRPAKVLADASASASLVVVGSRGRNPFTRLLLGSVSQDVLQHARCPVAIVR